MRIVYYCAEPVPLNYNNFYDCACSGTAGTLMLVARILAQRGHEVIVLNRSDSGNFHNVRHIRTQTHEECISHVNDLGSADVFVANGFSANIFLTHKINAKSRLYWLHNYIDINPYLRSISDNRLDYICCVSQSHLESFWHCKWFERFFYVYNPLCTDELRKITLDFCRENKIMFVGAPRQSKGFHDALRLFSAYHKEHPEYKLYVAGSANLHNGHAPLEQVTGLFEKDYFDKQLAQYLLDNNGNIHPHIVLLGSLDKRSLFKHLASAKMCILNPSWDSEPETLGMSALEAQALGVPVVTVWRGGQAESVQHRRTGFCLQTTEENRVIKLFELLLNNEETWQIFSQNATIRSMQLFNEYIIADKWESYLNSIISKKCFHNNRKRAIAHKLSNKIVRFYYKIFFQ